MSSEKNTRPKAAPAGKKAAAAPSSPPPAKAPSTWERQAKTRVSKKAEPKTQDAEKPERSSKLPGGKGNPGRPLGSKSTITDAKLKFLATTGQTPLEFLTAVYRNELYDEYEVEIVDQKRNVFHVFPKLDPLTGEVVAKKIPVDLQQRIQAATSAAPYVHRKKPIGIDGGEGKPVSFVSAAQLAQLSDEELDKLLSVLGKLSVAGQFEGADVPAHGLFGEEV